MRQYDFLTEIHIPGFECYFTNYWLPTFLLVIQLVGYGRGNFISKVPQSKLTICFSRDILFLLTFLLRVLTHRNSTISPFLIPTLKFILTLSCQFFPIEPGWYSVGPVDIVLPQEDGNWTRSSSHALAGIEENQVYYRNFMQLAFKLEEFLGKRRTKKFSK